MMATCSSCRESSDVHASELEGWLADRLHEQRLEVLKLLEDSHRKLASQIVMRSRHNAHADMANALLHDEDTFTVAPNRIKVLLTPDFGGTDSPRPPPTKGDDNLEAMEEPSDAGSELAEVQSNEDTSDGRMARSTSRMSMLTEIDLGPLVKFGDRPIGHLFEVFWSVVILANAIVMALKAQYTGLQVGYDLSIRTYTRTQKDAWPGGELAFDFFEKAFTILFTIELMIRVIIFKRQFLRDAWCYFDTIIVVVAWIIFFQGDIGMNVTFIRLLRFSKMMRVIKLMKKAEIFDSLRLLVASISASINTLFWSLLILLLIQCLAGLFMTQMLEDFLQDSTASVETRRKVFSYFGTFWRAMITMFEITFANWAPSCRLLVDQVAEAYGAFYLAYRCIIGFAVLMVVQAVFIQQTTKMTQLDEETMAKQHLKAKARIHRKLEQLFRKLDIDRDGFLDIEEVHMAIENPDTKALFALVDIQVDDFETLFKLLDDGDGHISVDEFVTGIEHMKGGAREIDLMQCLKSLAKIEAKLGVRPTVTRPMSVANSVKC